MNVNMHATTEQLLEIKDGLSNSVSLHVQSCQRCQQELDELRCLNRQIFDAADQQPRPELWSRIVASAQMTNGDADSLREANRVVVGDSGFVEENKGERRISGSTEQSEVPVELLIANSPQGGVSQSLSKAIYSLAASVLVTGFIGLYIFGQQGTSYQQNALLQANIQELMLNSRGMELALQKVAFQNELLSTSQQSEAERLYWRLTYVDQMIQEDSADSNTNPERVKVLWNERIDALTELNQIYNQRQRVLDDSEI